MKKEYLQERILQEFYLMIENQFDTITEFHKEMFLEIVGDLK